MTSANTLLMMEERSHLEALLHRNVDIFTWTHSNMLGINPSVAAHKLNILSNMCLVR